MRPTIRQRTPRRSSVLRSRQRHRQRIGPSVLMTSKRLKEVYFDPNRVGSYGGVDALRRVTHAPRKIVAQLLSEQDAYSLHKPARRRFKRRCVIVGGMNQQWQADLVDLTTLKDDNDGMTFLLTIIDVFSKRARCIPMPSKSAASLVAALQIAFADDRPQTLQTDRGMKFMNKSVQVLFRKRGVHHFSTHNAETKASIVERFNRTLKTRMWHYFTKFQTWRYIDVLPDLVRTYNDTRHRNIGMAPSQVNAKYQENVWQRLYGHDGKGVPKLNVSDRVRVSNTKARSKRATRRTGAKRCSPYTKFIPPSRPCTACGTISATCWTAPSTNWSCTKCRYRTIKCTASNRYCSVVRSADERMLW